MIISNYLEIYDIAKLSSTWRKYNSALKNYYEIYRRECIRIFSSDLNLFESLFQAGDSTDNVISHKTDPGFLCKGNADKIWVKLVSDGWSLLNQWKKLNLTFEWLNHEIFQSLGQEIFQTLKIPDPTVPALIKEDKMVDLHSVYWSYLYEYYFRMKDIYSGKRPTSHFTSLSDAEVEIKKSLTQLLINVDEITEEISENDKISFFNIRWYWSNPAYAWASNQNKLQAFETNELTSTQINSYYTSNTDSTTYASTQFKGKLSDILKKPDVKSNLSKLLLLLHDTITFHCKMTNEIIIEIDDDIKFLQEYDKRWNAFVASMIKLDEMLSPLWRIINKVYKRVFKDYPSYPNFSFLRFFIFIWRREVYNMCKESIEDNLIKILAKFHSSYLTYCNQENKRRKIKENNCFQSSLLNNQNSQKHCITDLRSPPFPKELKIKLNATQEKKNGWNAFVADQYNELDTVLRSFANNRESKLPKFATKDKDIFSQMLTDIIDLSMNEYSVHYINHSENNYMTPYNDLMSHIKNELQRFYIKSIESTPFKLWSEVVDEHAKVLNSFFPITLQNQLNEQRFSFVKKYWKERVKLQYKRFSERAKQEQAMASSSNNASSRWKFEEQDPTLLTQDEWLEIEIAQFKHTPFADYLASWVKIRPKDWQKLLAYIKENEVDIIKIYNSNSELYSLFKSNMEQKNSEVYRYKSERGFPFKFEQSKSIFYSFDHEISMSYIEKIRTENGAKAKTLTEKSKPLPFSRSSCVKDEFDWDDDMTWETKFSGFRSSVTEKRTQKWQSVFDFINELDEKDVNMETENSKFFMNEEQKSEEQRLSCIKPTLRNTTIMTKKLLVPLPFQKEANDQPFSYSDRRSCIEQNRSSLLPSNMLRLADFDNIDEDVEMGVIPDLPKFGK